jgi:hypothetical protein
MERYCSTGQSPQRAVAPTEEEEEESYNISVVKLREKYTVREAHTWMVINGKMSVV